MGLPVMIPKTLCPCQYTMLHKITERLAEVRKQGILPFLRPDGKSQVTIEYEESKPVAVNTVVVAAQHSPDVAYNTLREAIIEEVVKKVIPAHLISKDIKYYINATGRFVVGGPMGDCGAYRPKDHLRYVRRTGQPRRGMLFRKRSF